MITPPSHPRIGLIGSEGHYGRWLRRFFEDRMGLEVVGTDPVNPAGPTPEDVLNQCQVLLFTAPIRHTPQIIEEYIQRAAGREEGQLWLDVTSVKNQPVAAMLRSRAEVVGLHPMTAAPKSPTLKGRVLVVCEARLSAWRPWVTQFIHALRAECVHTTPEKHDQIMALVQAMVHATHLAQAGVLCHYADQLGGLDALLPFRSASFELDGAILSRILSMNPAIYEDIQFGNPHVLPMLDSLHQQISTLRQHVTEGSDAARQHFRQDFLDRPKQILGDASITAGNYSYERVGYLLADLAGERSLSVYLPQDQPGSLRALLHVFEQHKVNIASIHSSRTPSGELHFRMGFDGEVTPTAIAAVIAEIQEKNIGELRELSQELQNRSH